MKSPSKLLKDLAEFVWKLLTQEELLNSLISRDKPLADKFDDVLGKLYSRGVGGNFKAEITASNKDKFSVKVSCFQLNEEIELSSDELDILFKLQKDQRLVESLKGIMEKDHPDCFKSLVVVGDRLQVESAVVVGDVDMMISNKYWLRDVFFRGCTVVNVAGKNLFYVVLDDNSRTIITEIEEIYREKAESAIVQGKPITRAYEMEVCRHMCLSWVSFLKDNLRDLITKIVVTSYGIVIEPNKKMITTEKFALSLCNLGFDVEQDFYYDTNYNNFCMRYTETVKTKFKSMLSQAVPDNPFGSRVLPMSPV